MLNSHFALYVLMIMGSVFVGGMIPLYMAKTKHHLHFILSISAGLMLGAALIHLQPSSFELIGKQASLWVLAGFLFLYLVKKFFTIHLCELLECEVHPMGLAATVGIALHSFIDGIALGSGLALEGLGLVVFLTIFFHKIPEAFALSAVLINENRKKTTILFFNFLLAIMVPLGALLAHYVIGESEQMTGIALAFAAGTFLHISLSDLLPHVHEHAEEQSRIYLAFVLGLAAMWALQQWESVGGGHTH